MIDDLAARAVARALDRLEAAAAAELPADIDVARQAEGLRLSGSGLRLRWLTDVRLAGLSLAARVRP